MTHEYLRVTPTSAGLDPDVVSSAIATLHKLSATGSNGVIDRLIPFRSDQPVTLLDQVSLLTRPAATEDAGVHVES